MKEHPLQGVIVTNFFSKKSVCYTRACQRLRTFQPLQLCILIINGKFAEVSPEELRHSSLWFPEGLHSIISALLSVLNLAVGLE